MESLQFELMIFQLERLNRAIQGWGISTRKIHKFLQCSNLVIWWRNHIYYIILPYFLSYIFQERPIALLRIPFCCFSILLWILFIQTQMTPIWSGSSNCARMWGLSSILSRILCQNRYYLYILIEWVQLRSMEIKYNLWLISYHQSK